MASFDMIVSWPYGPTKRVCGWMDGVGAIRQMLRLRGWAVAFMIVAWMG